MSVEAMVRDQLAARGLDDPRLLAAFRLVPRDCFVPPELASRAWEDCALPIGSGQTISQPYIVALMTNLLKVREGSRILEIGTGCGYQTAILRTLGAEVYSIEIVAELAREARERLADLGFNGEIHIRCGDGYDGWPEKALFDGILCAAAVKRIPSPWFDQLAPEGRIVVPEGRPSGNQVLVEVTRKGGKIDRKRILPVRFVPFLHRVE